MRKVKFIICLLVLSALCACSKKSEDITSEAEEAPSIHIESPTKSSEEESLLAEEGKEKEDLAKGERLKKDGKIESFLSGNMVDEAIGNRRPLAIMISNDKEARPQYGLLSADIVYEAPVEGEMNRYMALIEDYDKLEKIGSVRSARTYYTYFAKEWDAVLAHFSQSTFALPYLKNLDTINGVNKGNSYFYRTKDKKKPHNAYTSGELVNKARADFSYRENYEEDYKGNFKFAQGEENLSEGKVAEKVTPGYSYNKPYFVYNSTDKLYYRFQYGAKHESEGAQIAVDNIILSYNRITYYATTQYKDIALHEENPGYFITRGKFIPIKILKNSEFKTTHYYDMSGNEINFNRGKTWICIIDKKNFDKTEISDIDGNKTNAEE